MERLPAVANDSTCAIARDTVVWETGYDKGQHFEPFPVIKHFHLALGIACGFTTQNANQQTSQTQLWIYCSQSKQYEIASIHAHCQQHVNASPSCLRAPSHTPTWAENTEVDHQRTGQIRALQWTPGVSAPQGMPPGLDASTLRQSVISLASEKTMVQSLS